ncbi:hypothetical protein, variant 1 [Aphanomyces invadans]|uniref:Glycoside hydrolase family 5 domain-containing protein n=1 Tax=Aphanomyces invadans TaxID=157072 RepID=A0A024U5B6_9STRA|nr:hypothetical protein, variant 1 [Aphanomyces invadans]ETW00813.1 hypothetical protein, variant 1 [Aphanomyces invadans]|eukprot:XP_008870948.1 hypothetical protein, variant 1 [Aphanomyces invadans]
MASSVSFHLELRNGHFVDADGRVVLLRGVNLGGSTKVPSSAPGSTSISFVNRPFPLTEADEHFSRLQRWGFNCIRFLVTWEAIEHAGPGIYDTEYLAYVRAILVVARKYGMYIYIDPHQDAWSRWTGGDGAPLWTLTDLGLNPANFDVTKAALCADSTTDYPKMVWPTNNFKFACATLATLFWAGNLLAPGVLLHGEPVQDVLQRHYINSMVQLAHAVADLDHVMGFGSMNEPVTGYIGVADIEQHFTANEFKLGYAPTPFQGMCLANGIDCKVEVWSTGINQYILGRSDRKESVAVNGVRAWKDGVGCIWKELGLYDVDPVSKKPTALRRDYFQNVDFGRDCYVPFATAYAASIRQEMPRAMLFVEMPPMEFMAAPFPTISIPRSVNATHWYDGITLFFRVWLPWFTVNMHTPWPVFGRKRVRVSHVNALSAIKATTTRCMPSDTPTLIGECGIPFNLNDGAAYETGDFQPQVDAMDNTISSLETNVLNYTLWCYTSDNTNQTGDNWNLEDFSLFSRDQAVGSTDRDAGGRAKQGYVRPAAWRVQGVPTKSFFDLESILYTLEFVTNGAAVDAPTVIYVPRTVHFQDGVGVTVSDGTFSIEHLDGYDLVHYCHDPNLPSHSVVIKRNHI